MRQDLSGSTDKQPSAVNGGRAPFFPNRPLGRRHEPDGKLVDDEDDTLDELGELDEDEMEELDDEDDALSLTTGTAGFGLTDIMDWSTAAGMPGEHWSLCASGSFHMWSQHVTKWSTPAITLESQKKAAAGVVTSALSVRPIASLFRFSFLFIGTISPTEGAHPLLGLTPNGMSRGSAD